MSLHFLVGCFLLLNYYNIYVKILIFCFWSWKINISIILHYVWLFLFFWTDLFSYCECFSLLYMLHFIGLKIPVKWDISLFPFTLFLKPLFIPSSFCTCSLYLLFYKFHHHCAYKSIPVQKFCDGLYQKSCDLQAKICLLIGV